MTLVTPQTKAHAYTAGAIGLVVVGVRVMILALGWYVLLVIGMVTVFLARDVVRILRNHHALQAQAVTDRDLTAIARSVAQEFGSDPPEVYLFQSPAPALQTEIGIREPGAIVTTTALTEQLSDDELRAGLAHEISHIVHHHTMVILVLQSLLAVIEWGIVSVVLAFILDASLVPGFITHAWTPLSAVVIVTTLAVIFITFNHMAVRTRYHQERAADRDAIAYIGDAIAYADVLEKMTWLLDPDQPQSLRSRVRFAYRLDAQEHIKT